ncbi:MAG TPA: carbohydrate ABC transporter permease [Ktedonobacteraceae bacterium]|jgi:multiple sugar transport system permease protein|nr:carbohydrate ABC transporter permease [Ktedonobacteraceae bacterium]
MAVRMKMSVDQEKRHQQNWILQGLTMVCLVLFLVYFLLPFFWLIVSATKTNPELFSSFGLWFAPNFNLFNNLSDLFTNDGGVFLNWLWNTTYYAVCSAVGASLIATIAGYTFAKFQFPGRNVVFAIILGSIMVPGTALAIPTYLLLSKIGLINTPLAVILPSLVSPFGVFLMRMYSEQAVPNELLDAGRVDGAGEIRIFWSVALRILAPGFVTVLLFSFVATWNNYFLPLLLLSNPSYYPLTLGLASWNAQASANGGAQLLYTLVITGSLVSIIPLIVGFLFLQRYWQGGLTFGSVKS